MNKSKIKKKRMKTNTSAFYIIISLLIIFILAFFLSSKLLFDEKLPVKFSELNVVHELQPKGEIIINEWKYDSNRNTMEIFLTASKVKDYDSDLSFSSVSILNRKQLLDTNIIYKEEDDYVIRINGVPKNFEQLALRVIKTKNDYADLFTEGDNGNSDRVLIKTLYTDQRVVDSQVIDEHSKKNYAIMMINGTIKELKDEKNKLIETNDKIDQAIELLNVQISDKEEEKVYQTAEEQLETTATIHSLLYKIKEMESEKDSNLEHMKINDRKIEKKVQKRNDIELAG